MEQDLNFKGLNSRVRPTALTAGVYLDDMSRTLPASLRKICETVINDTRFKTAPGGSGNHHHNYFGGLIIHTAEVVKFCNNLSFGFWRTVEKSLNIDLPVLRTAAILHDYGKIYEYTEVDGMIGKTKYRNQIRHVAGSHAHFYTMAIQFNLDPEIREAIEHCILSHHGRMEWGSPVEPQTPEAGILHLADVFSAQHGSLRHQIP